MSVSGDTGRRGEEIAAVFLSGEGFEILHRNWRAGRYELDIVARKDGILHVVEVKSRHAGALTGPEDAMTRTKFDCLCRAAEAYVCRYGLDVDVQFDLVAVEFSGDGYQVRYVPNAMVPRW